ncbi:hypothetical protein GCM10017673_51340 [Streptosporangium violaceochromogenes]|nr:hypothetical protein GCM10017673_51340 [Streptosporangium violaceochromogenes]
MRPRDRRLLALGAAAALALGTATTAGLATASGAFLPASPGAFPGGNAPPGALPSGERCAVPPLTGTVVDVTVTDAEPMMGDDHGPGRMRGGDGRWPGPMGDDHGWWPHRGMPGMGMMRLFVSPDRVPHGTVSLRVLNTGTLPHEVVVLPLPAGRDAGRLPEGVDGRADETGDLGEASRTCAAGAGDGIAPGAAGWTTLNLGPGRYALICNLPGHYAAGMYAELDVTG